MVYTTAVIPIRNSILAVITELLQHIWLDCKSYLSVVGSLHVLTFDAQCAYHPKRHGAFTSWSLYASRNREDRLTCIQNVVHHLDLLHPQSCTFQMGDLVGPFFVPWSFLVAPRFFQVGRWNALFKRWFDLYPRKYWYITSSGLFLKHLN